MLTDEVSNHFPPPAVLSSSLPCVECTSAMAMSRSTLPESATESLLVSTLPLLLRLLDSPLLYGPPLPKEASVCGLVGAVLDSQAYGSDGSSSSSLPPLLTDIVREFSLDWNDYILARIIN